MNKYDKQTNDFCKKYSVTITSKYESHRKYFPGDDTPRAVFVVTISRPNRADYSFTFGTSIHDSYKEKRNWPIKKIPSNYNILACLTKSDPGTFQNFCDDFGCDTDSRNALDTYLKVQTEFDSVHKMFSDCLDDLIEIN